ncbi:MAG TPA: VanW family protein [Dermatophilaceae bacterium]|nr:VanW family protein [Dermatophilaceae bacterium]
MTTTAPPDHDGVGRGTRRGRRALLVTLVVLVVAAAGYLGLAAWSSGRVPTGTTVGGVDVGGLDGAAALEAVEAATADLATRPVRLTAGKERVELDPADAGLGIDAAASVDGLTGFTADPADLAARWRGGSERDLVVKVDDEALRAAVDKAAPTLRVAVAEGSISVSGGTVRVKQPVLGRSVDVDATAAEVAERWPTVEPVPAVTAPVPPRVSAAEVERVRTEFAQKAVSGPVTVRAGEKSFEVSAAAIARTLSFPAKDGRITPRVDDEKLLDAVRDAADAAGVEQEAVSAKVRFANGQPSVTPSRTGVAIVDASVVEPVTKALTATDRTATVTTKVVQPRLTTAEAKATLPKGQISTFTTYYPFVEGRVTNIRTAARTLDGTYVGPGETFSLNEVLGERTPAKGYREAPVINGGRLVKDYGGGVSQVSTTTFNAAFFAGMRFLTYKPHSFYISRYPEGREATVSWPAVDQKWVNTTRGGVLIKATATDRAITVSMYGTKTFDVTATKSARTNIVQPKVIRDDSPGCVPQSPSVGFDVTVTRTMRQDGTVVSTERFFTRYIPEDDVTCTNPQ